MDIYHKTSGMSNDMSGIFSKVCTFGKKKERENCLDFHETKREMKIQHLPIMQYSMEEKLGH